MRADDLKMRVAWALPDNSFDFSLINDETDQSNFRARRCAVIQVLLADEYIHTQNYLDHEMTIIVPGGTAGDEPAAVQIWQRFFV